MLNQQEYNTWHIQHDHTQEDPLAFQWYQTVNKLLPDLNNLKVLEIGCGNGAFSKLLVERFPQIVLTAADISDAAISRAKTISPHIDFRVEDAQHLSLDDELFDYVISCETLEHVLEPRQMLKEIYRVLKPGGRFIITTENYFNGMFLMWLKSWIMKKPFNSGTGFQPHENFFTFFIVSRLIRKQLLKIDHTESNHFQWLMMPGVSPHQLCTQDFKNRYLKRIFRPFGRHYTFCGLKPADGKL